jgi:hypothetical protein
MQVFTVRGLDRVSAEVRVAELRLQGYQTTLVPLRERSGSYNVVYWATQKSIDVCSKASFFPFPRIVS